MEVFLTPEQPPPSKGRNNNGKANKMNKEGLESNKRNRSDEESSEIESGVSDASSWYDVTKAKKKKKKAKKDDRLNTTIVGISSGDEDDKEESDMISSVKELGKRLSKIKSSTWEIKSYTADPNNNVKNIIKLHAGQADRQLDAVIMRLKNIELRLENRKLKHNIQVRNMGTQSSPIENNREQTITEKRASRPGNSKGMERKGKGKPSNNTAATDTYGETDSEGEMTERRGKKESGNSRNKNQGAEDLNN